MGDDESWTTLDFRQSVVFKIAEAIRLSGMEISRNSLEMENHVFQRAKTKEEYLGYVARLILHIREMNTKKGAGMGMPGSNQGGPGASDPIIALQALAIQGTRNPLMTMGAQQQVSMGPQQRIKVANQLAGQIPNQLGDQMQGHAQNQMENQRINDYSIDIDDMPVILDNHSTISDSLNTTENPSPALPDITPAPVRQLAPPLRQNRKRIGRSSVAKKRNNIYTLRNRFVQSRKIKDRQEGEIRLKKIEILNIKKQTKLMQLAALEQQLQAEKQLYELNFQNRLEEIECERKTREMVLRTIRFN